MPVVTLALARYNADGTLDNTFGTGGSGVVVTDFGGSDDAYEVAVHTDGTIIVAGRNGTDSVVARYTSAGAARHYVLRGRDRHRQFPQRL